MVLTILTLMQIKHKLSILIIHAYFSGVGIPLGPEIEVFLDLGLEPLLVLINKAKVNIFMQADTNWLDFEFLKNIIHKMRT